MWSSTASRMFASTSLRVAPVLMQPDAGEVYKVTRPPKLWWTSINHNHPKTGSCGGSERALHAPFANAYAVAPQRVRRASA